MKRSVIVYGDRKIDVVNLIQLKSDYLRPKKKKKL